LTHALVGVLTLLLGTALVLAGAVRAARAAGLRDTLGLLVSVPVVAATQIVASLVFAGVILGRLNVVAVLATNVVVTGTILSFVRGAREPGRRLGLRDARTRLAAACRSHPIVATLVALASAALAWRVVLALALPPYGFDQLTYHLPTVIGWLQTGRISTSPLNTCCAYYPENGELLVTWPALLGGGVEYVDLVQIATALLGASAVAGIARAARLPAHGAAAAAALFVLTPVVLAQANTADVDVTFTATGLAAYYLVLRSAEATGRRRWFLFGAAGAATGLCIGTKPTGIEFLATLAVPLAVGAVLRSRWTWRETGIAATLFAVPTAALGITWYLRSWIVTHNPFHPMDVRFLGVTVFAGTNHLRGAPLQIRRHFILLQPLVSWLSDIHFWTKNGYAYGGEFGGLGPVWSYFGVVLTIVFAVYAWRRRRPVFWLFLVPTALLFAIQPDHWYSRYTIGLAAAGSIAVAWAMTASWRPAWARLALGAATVVLAAGGAWLASRLVLPGWTFRALGPKLVLSDALHGRRTVGTVFDHDYAWIDRLRRGAPIGFDVHSVLVYAPFAGRDFQNRLVVIPHRTDLRAFVASHDVAYVVTRPKALFDLQARSEPGCFERLGGRHLVSYRIKARCSAAHRHSR
jgi:4-amino-4-deoxy-L-arabinose transferase-like glycosyltransferase